MGTSIQRTTLFAVGLIILAASGCDRQTSHYDHEPPATNAGICGGIAALTCGNPGDFCNVTNGSCGLADQTGVCTPRPEVCTADFSPVCGCNGHTYSNACNAAAAGASVASEGPCLSPI